MWTRGVTAILCCLGLACAVGHAAASPEAFTQEFAAALRDALPSHEVTITEPLRFKVKAPDGKESSAYLENAYNEYVQDPTSKDEIVGRYTASLVETFSEAEALDPKRIVPVIKDVAWLQDMKRATGASTQVFEDFNGDLVIVYAEDTPANTRYFSREELAALGTDRRALRALAVTNLRRILPPVKTHTGRSVSMLTAGGDYVASLLLFDELWSGGKLAVDGEIVVAVPSRDVLLFTGSRNREGVRQLRAMAKQTAAEGPYSLTDQLFVYRNGTFQRFTQ